MGYTKDVFGVLKLFCILSVMVVIGIHAYVKTPGTVHKEKSILWCMN